MELNLSENLCLFLEHSLQNLVLPSRGPDLSTLGPERSVRVFDSYLPIKEEETEDPYPFVIVRPTASVVENERITVEVSLIVGTFAADSRGFQDALNVSSAIRNSLLQFTQSPLAEKFYLMPKLEWRTLEDQPWPYWQMEIKTTWATDFPLYVTSGAPNVSPKNQFSQDLEKALYG